ncbi:MAG: cytochrome b N-terminal domain-containing protein [Deltaproteobacteria bacterium]|nr:cytochrome b N-terminal domain-containing protein [Deltaproteobacteria bacterium]
MGIRPFIKQRLGLDSLNDVLLGKPVGEDVNWLFTLGSLSLLLFMVQAVTGTVLAFYYVPSPDYAYQSMEYIVRDVTLGGVIQGIHHWAASAMVIVVVLHMMRTFFFGSYLAPRELTWIVGVLLLVATLAFGFTGYLLPWDQKAYWATVIGTSVPKDIPIIGPYITRLLRGGEEVSALTLSRFYSVHMLILPACMMLFVGLHIYLIRLHDMAGHWREDHPGKSRKHPFFPYSMFKDSVIFTAVFALILVLAFVAPPEREKIAGTLDPAYQPRPEWYFMWLFQLLKYFEGKFEAVGTLVIPGIGFLLLLILPFLGRNRSRNPADRPLVSALVVTAFLALVYMSFLGAADSYLPYGKVATIPDRPLHPKEVKGVQVFVDKDCAYCHHILGRGGRREGPDLSNVVAKDRSKEWLIRFIRDPKSVNSWSVMPKYDFTQDELEALAQYILALDFDTYHPRLVDRQKVLEGRIPVKQ